MPEHRFSDSLEPLLTHTNLNLPVLIIPHRLLNLYNLGPIKLNHSRWDHMPPTIPQRSHAQLNPQRTDPSQMRIALILLNLKLRIYDIGEIPKSHGDFLVCVGLGVE